jgi:hypothetical protein
MGIKIKKIEKINHDKQDVYCLNVEEHNLIIKGSKDNYVVGNCNFGLLFNETSRAFAGSTLLSEWSLQEAKDYVKLNKLEAKQRSYYKILTKDISPEVTDVECFMEDQLEFSFYWASADDIKIKFFDTYKGLAEWQQKTYSFARHNGYVQSLWGPLRRIPYLIYHGKDDDTARIKNYENISVNSPVQNGEAMYMMYNMARVRNDLKAKNMKSVQVGNIHDSSIAYLLRDEMQKDKEIYLNRFQEPMTPMEGIPYDIELGYSDITNGEVWGITEHEF